MKGDDHKISPGKQRLCIPTEGVESQEVQHGGRREPTSRDKDHGDGPREEERITRKEARKLEEDELAVSKVFA